VGRRRTRGDVEEGRQAWPLRSGRRKMPDPLEGLDTSSLSDDDRVEIEKLRTAYDRGGKDGIVKDLADLAKNNSKLLKWLLANFLD
jgi:hypothetical protein